MQTNDDDNSETQEYSKSNATSPNAIIEETEPTDDEVGNVTDGPDKSMEWKSGTEEHDMGDASVSPGTGSEDRDPGRGRQRCVAPNQDFLSGILYTLFVVMVFMTIALIISTATDNNSLGTCDTSTANKVGHILDIGVTLMVDLVSLMTATGSCFLMFSSMPFLLLLTPTLDELHWETSVTFAELIDVSSEGWTIPIGATLVNIELVPRTDTNECAQHGLTMPYYHFTVKEWRELPPLVLHGTDQTPMVEYAS